MYRLVLDQGPIDLDQDVVLVGRRAGVDVPIPHPQVGGVHLRLERDGRVVHAVPTGPTTVNGSALTDRRALSDGDEIVLGGTVKLRFESVSPAASPTTKAGTHSLAKKMMQELVAGAPPPTLELEGGKTIALPPPGKDLVIGRGESCDVALPDPDLSREHARIRRGWAAAVLVDLGSKNGTIVDGERVPPGGDVHLADGARIEIGSTTLRFRDPAEAILRELAGEAPPRRRINPRIAIAAAAIVVSLAALAVLLLSR